MDAIGDEIVKSQRALEVSERLAQGDTPREAAAELGLSTRAVNEVHEESLIEVRELPAGELVEAQLALDPAGEGDRRNRALTLKIQGYNYRQIDEALAMRRGWAATIVPEELARIDAATIRNTDQVRALQIARLEGLLKAASPDAERGDVQAITAALRVIREINKIEGTYAPVKVDVDERIKILAVQLNVDEDELMADARQLAKEYALRAINNG